MTEQPHRDNPDNGAPYHGGRSEQKPNWIERRREKIVAEIHANRRGEYTVPTWVLAVALVAMIAAICTWMLVV
jgi:Rieske Fe-S protein